MRLTVSLVACLAVSALAPARLAAAPRGVSFEPAADARVDAYRFFEVAVRVDRPDAKNPFTDVTVDGEFGPAGGPRMKVDGFCDADDGSVFRVRFMPTRPGRYEYAVRYRQGDFAKEFSGAFEAVNAGRRGPVRVDKDHPWHFVWEGTGEHYFWNGTTTYWLLGWDDDTIRRSVDRLARLKVNRLRVALSGRTADGRRWHEPQVVPTDKFKFRLEPWPAARPDDV
jgi:hypothetical protein